MLTARKNTNQPKTNVIATVSGIRPTTDRRTAITRIGVPLAVAVVVVVQNTRGAAAVNTVGAGRAFPSTPVTWRPCVTVMVPITAPLPLRRGRVPTNTAPTG